MRRVLRVTTAASLSSLMRMVSTCAHASSVPAKASARLALDEHIAQGREQHAQLVALEMVAARTRGKQTHLGLLDAVLGLATLAVQIVVQRLRLSCQVGHHVARIVSLRTALQARDDPALARPGLGRIDKLADLALFDPAALEGILHCEFEEFGDLLESGVARQPDDVVHIGTFAVVQDELTAKARIATEDDTYLGPLLAQALGPKASE